MNKQIVDTIMSIFMICLGLGFSILNKTIARRTLDYYRRAWPFPVPSGEWFRVGFFVTGITAIIFGSLTIFGIIHLK